MKLFTNLPNTLRVLFGTLRVLTLVMGAFWLFILIAGPVLKIHFGHESRFMGTAGEVLITDGFKPIPVEADGMNTAAITLTRLRGTLSMDISSGDKEMSAALRWTIFPAMVAFLTFSFLFFSSLRNLCANIGRGEVFSDRNLRLVRGIGAILIIYAFIEGGLKLWAAHVMNGYLRHHQVMADLQMGLESSVHILRFQLAPGMLSMTDNLIVGCCVLVITEVFRQGLALKVETDLTV